MEKHGDYRSRMLLLLSVTQPGQLTPVALRPSFARGVPLSVQVLLQITGGSWLGASFWKLNKCKEKVSTGLSRVVLGAV